LVGSEMCIRDRGRVAWALDNLPGEYVLSSSFGIQAAVSLHLVNQIRPDIPVILTDTGYLFPETYRFIDELTDKLKLNLKVYRATESAAWQLSLIHISEPTRHLRIA
ncbi:phosphoadenosine phosphosulfate reductase domain-containing protein, partial [Escherichia coli]